MTEDEEAALRAVVADVADELESRGVDDLAARLQGAVSGDARHSIG